MRKKAKKSFNKGITLVALVITIIVLLILAGLGIAMLTGENGILGKASKSKEETIKAEALQDIKIRVMEAQVKNNGKATLSNIVEILTTAQDEYKVITKTKTASLTSDSVTTNVDSSDSILVTNTKYGKEVEVTKSLEISLTGTEGEIPGETGSDTTDGTISDTTEELEKSRIITGATLNLEQEGNTLNVDVDITTSSTINDVVLVLYVNNKLYSGYSKSDIENGNVKIVNTEPSTSYEVFAVLLDEESGVFKTSSAKTTTKEQIYSWKLLEYPILTTTGMKNMVYSDQYGNVANYKKDLLEGECTASDTLPKEAWDDNKSTYVTTGTYYLEVDSEMIGKNFTYNMYWESGCTSIFYFCDKDKNELDNWYSDVSGSKVIPVNTKYIKWYTNGHFLYEVPDPDV